MRIKSLKRPQTLGEEISNAVSHGIGSLLSIAGTVILIILGVKAESTAAVIWGAFYGATLIILYTVSCLYHSLARNKAKKVFRVLDHCSIFLLISGTYAPISVLMIGGKIGFSLITVNIACAVLGILLNAINMEKWKKHPYCYMLLWGGCVCLP